MLHVPRNESHRGPSCPSEREDRWCPDDHGTAVLRGGDGTSSCGRGGDARSGRSWCNTCRSEWSSSCQRKDSNLASQKRVVYSHPAVPAATLTCVRIPGQQRDVRECRHPRTSGPRPRSRTSNAELRGLDVLRLAGVGKIVPLNPLKRHCSTCYAEGERVELPRAFAPPVFETEADAVYRLDLPIAHTLRPCEGPPIERRVSLAVDSGVEPPSGLSPCLLSGEGATPVADLP